MNEHEQKIELDELISLYLDGEASERQQTELKRLMQHDPSITERLEVFEQQRRMLNNLPMEAAPASLADDIRAQMERKLILEHPDSPSQTVLAAGHLAVRRLLATAAMILLPLGLLGLVVFQIMKPPVDGPGGYVPARPIVQGTSEGDPSATQPAAAAALPFSGTLVMRTEDYREVSGQVKEAIEKQGLLGRTFPDRTANTTRFQVTASAGQVDALVDALAAIRPQCRQVLLQVAGTETDLIEIPDIEDKQLKMLVYEDNPQMLDRLAGRYAAANQKADPLFNDPGLNPDGYPEPSIPTLAGRYDTAERTVRLTIQIERAPE